MKLKPQTRQSVYFLESMFPDGICHLIAIALNGDIKCQTFVINKANIEQWINKYNMRGYNLYFAVNQLDETVRHKKAKREDVSAALFLHVDIDDLQDKTLEKIKLDKLF